MIYWGERKLLRNPVYKAIAKKQLKEAMLDMRIHLLMMDDGDDCSSEMDVITDSIHVIARAHEILKREDSVDYRKLKSAMSILRQCSETGYKWDRSWAITISNAIDICSQNWTKIPSPIFQQAMTEVLG